VTKCIVAKRYISKTVSTSE